MATITGFSDLHITVTDGFVVISQYDCERGVFMTITMPVSVLLNDVVTVVTQEAP